jgi:hypothetical protein
MPIADPLGETGQVYPLDLAGIEDYEIVACSVHLGKAHYGRILASVSGKAKSGTGINDARSSEEVSQPLDNRGEVCLEEEVEKRRRSGMSTEEIAQDMGVDPAWVQSLVSMTEGGESPASEREEAGA